MLSIAVVLLAALLATFNAKEAHDHLGGKQIHHLRHDHSETCGHHQRDRSHRPAVINQDRKPILAAHADNERDLRLRQSAIGSVSAGNFQNIRVEIETSLLFSHLSYKSEKWNRVKGLIRDHAVPQLIYYLPRIFSVYPSYKEIKLMGEEATECDDINRIPGSDAVFLTPYSADLLIVLKPISASQTWLSNSKLCRRNHELLNRPDYIVLSMNMPKILEADSTALFKSMLHNIFHGMGFGEEHFKDYKNPDGTAMTLGQFTEDISTATGIYTVIKFPRLVQLAKRHYNCTDFVEGVPFENTEDSIGSHWDLNYVGNEIMSPGTASSDIISQFTLAYFDSIGWYIINYELAEPLLHGQNRGCDFYQFLCTSKKQEYPEFCNSPDAYYCSDNHQYTAICTMDKASQPCYLRKNLIDCTLNSEHPDLGKTGPKSRCISTGNLISCHEVKCNSKSKITVILEDETSGSCRENGANLDIAGQSFSCPDVSRVCTEMNCPNQCSGHGTCNSQGKCLCRMGFMGVDCSKEICPNGCSGTGICNMSTMKCECDPGFEGDDCQDIIWWRSMRGDRKVSVAKESKRDARGEHHARRAH